MSLNLDRSTWKRVLLGDVATASKEKVDPTDGSIERYVAGEHMASDDLKIRRWGDIGDIELGPAFHRRFRPGQVLYGSRRTYLRKVAVADFDGVCANTTFVVETKDSEVLLQEFLPFIMTAEPFHAFAIAESKGSVNPYVNWTDIERYEFDLPSLDEQKRLADLLWVLENHRASLEVQGNAISAALIQFLIDRFTGASGKSIKIVDLCTSVVGGIWGLPEGENEINVLALGPRVYASGTTELSVEGSPVRSITQNQASSRIVQEGDIILERSGGSPDQPVGRVVIAGSHLPPCIPTDFQRLVRPNSEFVEPRYLFWKLRMDWLTGVTRDYSKRTTNITNLTVPDYLSRSFIVPAREKQIQLLADVHTFEVASNKVRDELGNLANIRSAILADAFGGAQ